MSAITRLTSCGSADHYAGLSETWDNGVIYCSEQTARLIQHMDQLRIKKDLVRPLPMDTPVTIDGDTLARSLLQILHQAASLNILHPGICPGCCRIEALHTHAAPSSPTDFACCPCRG